jgi:glutamate/tyrosine decarboxylase-like PLP-dependent enzyme
MRVDMLREAIEADRRAGRRPFCVVASAGTVATGAVDPLDQLADVCGDEGLWLHVDGAYGALGVLDPIARAQFRGMERADSLALDPHKWMSVPVECGAVLVRDAATLRAAFSLVPAYVATEPGKGFGGLPWFSEYGFQQTRGFRALKLWMVLSHLGREGLMAHVARHNALARRLAQLVDAAPDLELAASPTLSIVCFRYRPPHRSAEGPWLDDLNRSLMQDVQAGGDAFLTNAVLGGRFVLRACILHYATGEEDLGALIDAVRRAGSRLAGPTGAEPGGASF